MSPSTGRAVADAAPTAPPAGEQETWELAFQFVRGPDATHLVPAHGEAAVCGVLLSSAWATGRVLSCPVCASVLPPEAGEEPDTVDTRLTSRAPARRLAGDR